MAHGDLLGNVLPQDRRSGNTAQSDDNQEEGVNREKLVGKAVFTTPNRGSDFAVRMLKETFWPNTARPF